MESKGAGCPVPSNVPELAAVIWDLLENCIFQQQEQEVLAPELSLEGLSKADFPCHCLLETIAVSPTYQSWVRS